MLLAARISSYGRTWEVWRALKKQELLSAVASSNSYASYVLSKLPAPIHNAKHEPILNWVRYSFSLLCYSFTTSLIRSKKIRLALWRYDIKNS